MTERKQVKKLTIEIVDQTILAEAFPEVIRTVTVQEVDRQALRKIVNSFYTIGRQVPGVNAFYASEQGSTQTEAELPPVAASRTEIINGDDDLPAPHIHLKKKGA